MNKKLEWVILVTDKFKEAKKFYKDILGLKMVRESLLHRSRRSYMGDTKVVGVTAIILLI